MPTPEHEPQPPHAPDVSRHVHLHPWQWVGVPLLLLIPLLALLGVFGESRATVRAETAQIALELQYATRYRYKTINSLSLDVTNRTGAWLDTVTVEIDTAYVSRFSNVAAIPSFTGAYTIELTAVEPQETRSVRVELQGEHYGRHRGELRATASGADTARLQMSTFIFP